MTTINVNDGIYSKQVHALVLKGYRYATVVPRGDNKGNIISRHKTRDAAERAAKDRDRRVADLMTLVDIGAHE